MTLAMLADYNMNKDGNLLTTTITYHKFVVL